MQHLEKYSHWILGGAYLFLTISLLVQSDRPEVLGLGGLFVLTLGYKYWEDEIQKLSTKKDLGAIFIGSIAGLWIMYKALFYVEDEAFLRLLPFLGLSSWGLISYGWYSIKIFCHGLLLFGFLAFPWELVYVGIDLSLLTTKFTHWCLWVFGFESERLGTLIRLGSGQIEVYHGCSGLKMILQLLSFSLIYLVLVPQKIQQQIGILLGAIAVGFIINGLRVSLMAILVSLGDEAAFDYWHLGTGSLIFSGISVACLGLWSWQIGRWKNI